MKQISFKL